MNSGKSRFRIAAFQRKPLFDNIPATTCRLVDDMRRCDEEGVTLALFPECFLQGYTTDRQIISRSALEIDSIEMRDFAKSFASFSVDLVVGFIEQRAQGFFNSAALIRRGEVAGIYAKNHPNESAFLSGDASPVFRQGALTYGINICFDANFPDSARRLSDQGAQLICYPLNNMLQPATADRWRERSIGNLQARAIETGCWIASSDVVGTHDGAMSYGCTCIVNPDGIVVAKVDEGEEGSVIVDIE